MLRAVCFDLMDTVITDPYLAAMEAATGLAVPDLRGLVNPRAWPQFEVGAIDEDEFVRTFWGDEGRNRSFDVVAFHRARRDGYAFVPGMEELLDDLAGRVDRYVASNYPSWITEVSESFALARRFEGVFASWTFGVRKPDPHFYARLLDAIDHEPAACLFVDDRAANCEAAEAAGMSAHVFTDAQDLRRRLTADGVLSKEDA